MSNNNDTDLEAIQSVKQIGQISITRTSRSIAQLSTSARRWVGVGIVAALAHIICYIVLVGGAWWFEPLHMYGVVIYHLLSPLVFVCVVLGIYNIGNTNMTMPISSRFLVILALGFTFFMFIISGVYIVKAIITIVQCFGVNAMPQTFTPTTNTTSIIPGSEATVLCSGVLYALFWLTSIKALILMLLEGLLIVILLVLLSRLNMLNDAVLRRKWAIRCAEVGKDVEGNIVNITTDMAHDTIKEAHSDMINHDLHFADLLVGDDAHGAKVAGHLGIDNYATKQGYSQVNQNNNQEDTQPLINKNNGYNNNTPSNLNNRKSSNRITFQNSF